MSESYNRNPETASQIYEGGNYQSITVDDLAGNKVAIRQILNELNTVRKDIDEKLTEVQELKSENEYLKTSPFIGLISSIVGVVSSIVLTSGISLLTTRDDMNSYGWILSICGGILLIASGTISILFPLARKFFNKPAS